MLVDSTPPKPAAQPPGSSPSLSLGAGQPRHIDSSTLLGSRGEVYIVHHQQVYRLRVTAQGKLILTK